MKKTGRKIKMFIQTIAMALLLGIVFAGHTAVSAEDSASSITIDTVDYDKLTMKVYKNGNGIVYFSSDSRQTWNEVEGDSGDDSDGSGSKPYVIMDISWVNAKANTTIYLKGDKETTAVEVEFPKQDSEFQVTFNKGTLDFTFEGQGDADNFLWRKATDSKWQSVPFTGSEYDAFLKKVDELRFKGCKIVFMCDQVVGTGIGNMGQRPSREVKVSIPKIANAPSVKVNVKKFILNTKNTMEYYDTDKNAWVSCEKNMTISEIAPKAMYSSGEGETVKLKIRTAATETKSYSKTTVVIIPGQTGAPSFGESGSVKTSFSNNKLILTFSGASAATPIDYCIVGAGEEFNPNNAKWKTVKTANKQVKLSQKKAPDGSLIYIRYSGMAENAKKKISLKLPSYYSSTQITWPAASTEEKTKEEKKK